MAQAAHRQALGCRGVIEMAILHDLRNVDRRGNIWYWRPRIPRRFADCPPRARLSVSLRQSDHVKACYLARRLTSLLADLSLSPAAAMTSKDQLTAIFQVEVERMTEQLDTVALAARRYGRVDDVTEMETDIEVGWAYRLLELFGTARRLTFDDGCPGWALLRRNGIPASYIERIASTFQSEQDGLRSRAFDQDIRAELDRVGLSDTIANVERAKIEFFRARASVLLDAAGRWPLIDPTATALTRSVLPEAEREALLPLADEEPDDTNPVLPPQTSSPTPTSSLSPTPTVAGVAIAPVVQPIAAPTPNRDAANLGEGRLSREDAAPTTLDVRRSASRPSARDNTENALVAAAPTVVPAALQPQALSVATGGLPPATKRTLPLSDFMNEVEELVRNKGSEWTKATAADAGALVQMFRAVLLEEEVIDSGDIRQEHVAALRSHFNLIPKGYGQSGRLRAMKPAALRAYAEAMLEDGDLTPADVGLSAATIRKHLGNLDTFLKHLKARGYPIEPWTFDGLRPKKPKKGDVRLRQVKPGPQTVRPIFDMPIFVGCAGDDDRGRPGSTVIHSALYFVPMLYAYLGARRIEITGLAVSDVVSTENGPAIHIRENEFRRIKNSQSDRHLPIPDEVIRLGFLDYVEKIRKLGYRMLYPELYSPYLTDNDPGDRFYKEFVPLLKDDSALGGSLWSRAIHALRHGFANTVYQRGVDSAVIDDISGRIGESETTTRYTNPAGLPLIRTAISQYPVITEHLSATPIRLLGHVERKEPPPWAGRKPGDRFRRV